VPDKKCPVHGRKLVRPPRPVPSFSWATGYSSLENLAPVTPLIVVCPEPGCDYHQELEEEPATGPGGAENRIPSNGGG
jgi:hypothetical protein